MKKCILISCLLLIIGCKTKQINGKTIEKGIGASELNSVEKIQKDKAYELGKRLLITCNTSKFKPFTAEEATATVIKNTTQERLSKVCHKFRVKYGDFKELYLTKVLKNDSQNSYIFRYKAKYEREFAKKELRVTMDKNQKVTAIKSTDWVDTIE